MKNKVWSIYSQDKNGYSNDEKFDNYIDAKNRFDLVKGYEPANQTYYELNELTINEDEEAINEKYLESFVK